MAVIVFYFWSSGSSHSAKVSLFYEADKVLTGHDSIIRIMSYNVGYLSGMTNNEASRPEKAFFDRNYQNLKSHIQDTVPDIICFQEIDYNSKRSYSINLHDSLATLFYPCAVKAVNWDKKYVPFPYWPPKVHFGRVLSGQSVFSKWELSDTKAEVLKKVDSNPFYYNAYYLDRLLVSTQVKHPVHDFLLMNIHAEAFDTLTRNEHLQFAYEQFKKGSAQQAVILAGDFNATPESGEIGIRLFLNDTTIGCAVLNPGGNYYTFPSSNPTERIDYVFFTKKDFVEVSGRVAVEYAEISDHLPVVTQLRFRKYKY